MTDPRDAWGPEPDPSEWDLWDRMPMRSPLPEAAALAATVVLASVASAVAMAAAAATAVLDRWRPKR